ncbi:Transmembrane protein [Phytophthora cinnamomi]|uniref:Transmembrane protein n=1 Tax=Phytophthora cinnamomi TaxID=4785 RepID=UPI003559F513|nr:Transmembrane protein [Phytophthora cinnamomi]
MVLLARLQRYSRRQYVVALLVFSLFLAIIGQIQALPVLFVLSLPVVLFFRWVFRQQQHHGVTDREIEQLLRTFLGGAFLIPALAIVGQVTLGPLLAALCFFDQRDSIQKQLHKYFYAPSDGRAGPVHVPKLGKMLADLKLDKTVGYYLFLFGGAYIVAGLVEEFLKYWIVQGRCCCCSSRRSCGIRRLLCCCKSKNGSVPAFSALKQRQQRHGALRGMMCHPSRLLFYHRPHANHAFVVFLAVIAGALGFSVMENTGFALAAATFRDKIETAALRSISSTSLHCICGGITGVRMAERLLAHRQGGSEQRGTSAAKADLGRWRTKISVILPAVLIHGTFDAQLFLLMALVSKKMEAAHPTLYRTVLPTIISSVVILASFLYLRRKLHAMENKMNETRYMHVAVDLESGQRLGALNGGFGDDMDFFGNDDDDDDGGDSDAEDESFAQEGGNRKVRSVFDM